MNLVVYQNGRQYIISRDAMNNAEYSLCIYPHEDSIEYNEPYMTPLVELEDWVYMDDSKWTYNPSMYPRIAIKCPDGVVRYCINEWLGD